MEKKINYDPISNLDLDFDVLTNREWLNSLSDEKFAEEVIDFVRTLLTDFTRRSHKLTVKDYERSFVNWLKSQKFVIKNVEKK